MSEQYGRQYTRIDKVRERVDTLLKEIKDEEQKRCAYVHLYGVGLMAATIAIKQGYSRETAELAEIAGILHDLYCYIYPDEDTADHAHKCADYAVNEILSGIRGLSDEDKRLIYSGIYNHSDKDVTGDAFDEIIKDADALQHSLRNPCEEYFFQKERTQQALKRLINI